MIDDPMGVVILGGIGALLLLGPLVDRKMDGDASPTARRKPRVARQDGQHAKGPFQPVKTARKDHT